MVSARIVRSDQAPAYFPPKHTNVAAKRLQGVEAGPTEVFWVGESLYPVGASADRSATLEETVYVVLEGQLELSLEDGGTEVLNQGDSVHMPRGSTRSVVNNSSAEARLLVIIAHPRTGGAPS